MRRTVSEIRRAMEEVMGPMPGRPRRAPAVEVLTEVELANGLIRRKIEIDGEIPAYLFLPDGGVRAAVLCLHQTTARGKAEPAGLAGLPTLHYALELARLGFATLAPDYPNFGDYTFDPYAAGFASATMKGIVNHMRAVDVLAALVGDQRRIGVLGHSLGGHNSLFVAAFDERIRAVMTSCGFTSFRKYYGGDLTGWSHKGYMPRIATVYGKSPERMPFDFDDVLTAIAPRRVFVNAPLRDANFDATGVDDCVARAASPERITVRHPDAAHSFPDGIRREAYEFLRSALI